MKTFILSFALFLGANIAQATIYRLGYTGLPVAGKDFAFTDYASAENAASAGDTIQVYQQSASVQGSYGVTKAVKIIGFGHSLNVNANLQVQNKVDSVVNSINIYFYPGSAGASVQGLNLYDCQVHENNITITRCRFRNSQANDWPWFSGFVDCATGNQILRPAGGRILIYNSSTSLSNITINGCYFDNMSNWQYIGDGPNVAFGGGYPISNLIITNNYFNSRINLLPAQAGTINGVFANNIINLKFQHQLNIFANNGNICSEGVHPYYDNIMQSAFDFFLIKNNIFNTADTVTYPLNAQNCIVQNNIFSCASQYAGVTAGGTGNVYKADMATVFGATWNDGYVYNDNQLALGASSPAINTGLKGNNTATNCGIFGGEAGQEYRLSGIPPVPAVYLLTAPSINATTNPYNVTISVRSNN